MHALESFKKGLDVTLRWFCITLFVALVLLVCLQVAARYMGINAPWTEVAARSVFIWQGLIGAAYVIGEKDDVAIDFLVRKLPGGAVKAVEVLAHAIVAFFAIWIMVWGGAKLAISSWSDIVQLMPVSQGVLYLSIVITGALIAVYSLIHIIHTIVKPPPTLADPDNVDLSTVVEEGI